MPVNLRLSGEKIKFCCMLQVRATVKFKFFYMCHQVPNVVYALRALHITPVQCRFSCCQMQFFSNFKFFYFKLVPLQILHAPLYRQSSHVTATFPNTAPLPYNAKNVISTFTIQFVILKY
jgi:hypothetical protein